MGCVEDVKKRKVKEGNQLESKKRGRWGEETKRLTAQGREDLKSSQKHKRYILPLTDGGLILLERQKVLVLFTRQPSDMLGFSFPRRILGS